MAGTPDSSALDALARAIAGEAVAPEALTAALTWLDARLLEIAGALAIEHYGPGVGVEGAPDVYRIVARAHRLTAAAGTTWAVRICDASPAAGWRAMWSLPAASRARRAAVITALPAFLSGYTESARAAGKADTPAGKRLAALSQALAGRQA